MRQSEAKLPLKKFWFWQWFCVDHPISTIKDSQSAYAQQSLRVDISLAKLRCQGRGSEHRRFLQACQNLLEAERISTGKIREALSSYEQGECPSACFDAMIGIPQRKSA